MVIKIVAGLDQERYALVEERLEDYNSARSPALRASRDLPNRGDEPLQVYALDDNGDLAGGLTGNTWGGWLHIELLWVANERRGTGLGSKLLRQAETLARERGCTHSRVETWEFQAPEFYKRHSYRVVGVIEDYPPGETEYLLTKPLKA